MIKNQASIYSLGITITNLLGYYLNWVGPVGKCPERCLAEKGVFCLCVPVSSKEEGNSLAMQGECIWNFRTSRAYGVPRAWKLSGEVGGYQQSPPHSPQYPDSGKFSPTLG